MPKTATSPSELVTTPEHTRRHVEETIDQTRVRLHSEHRTAHQLARTAAENYFTALAREIPYDNAPGEVLLIEAAIEIEIAVRRDREANRQVTDRRAESLEAGYLLGVEVGKRIGGGR